VEELRIESCVPFNTDILASLSMAKNLGTMTADKIPSTMITATNSMRVNPRWMRMEFPYFCSLLNTIVKFFSFFQLIRKIGPNASK